MSSRATGWALQQPLKAVTKVILWAYAEHAHTDGRNAYISVITAAEYAGVDKGTAVRHIQMLVENGYLRFGDQSNISSDIPKNRRPVLYDLAMDDETVARWAEEYDPSTDPRLINKVGGSRGGKASAARRLVGLDSATPPSRATPAAQVGLDSATPVGLDSATPASEAQGLQNQGSGVAKTGVQGLHQRNPNKELNQEPNTNTQPSLRSGDIETPELALVLADASPATKVPTFEDFYAVYPRRKEPVAARKAWDKAVKLVGAERVMAGAERYANDPNLPEKQFIPYPASWLNNGCWDDEPEPVRVSANRGSEREPSTTAQATDAMWGRAARRKQA